MQIGRAQRLDTTRPRTLRAVGTGSRWCSGGPRRRAGASGTPKAIGDRAGAGAGSSRQPPLDRLRVCRQALGPRQRRGGGSDRVESLVRRADDVDVACGNRRPAVHWRTAPRRRWAARDSHPRRSRRWPWVRRRRSRPRDRIAGTSSSASRTSSSRCSGAIDVRDLHRLVGIAHQDRAAAAGEGGLDLRRPECAGRRTGSRRRSRRPTLLRPRRRRMRPHRVRARPGPRGRGRPGWHRRDRRR